MQKKYSFFKTVKFENMPRILILLLKRFIFNIVELKNIKINNRVEFPDILEMNNYMIPNNSNKQNIIYNLKAIIIYSGESEQGHYFSFIKDNVDNCWYKYNDEQVMKYDNTKVKIEAFGNNDNNNFYHETNAYLLFYEIDTKNIYNKDSIENKISIDDEVENINESNSFSMSNLFNDSNSSNYIDNDKDILDNNGTEDLSEDNFSKFVDNFKTLNIYKKIIIKKLKMIIKIIVIIVKIIS